MAKNDNLKDFLTDVANAIREKKGTTDLINPQDFSAEIASIETGGGEGGGGGADDVRFIDYDGTILHTYSKDDFLALDEMPPLPSQPGLTCQGWNWSLADAQTWVTEYDYLEIGATYITEDGRTKLYITIAEYDRKTISLYFNTSNAVIDWGDGSSESVASGQVQHTYSNAGSYVISLAGTISLTPGITNYNILGAYSAGEKIYMQSHLLKKVETGSNCTTIGTHAFRDCLNLETITISASVKSISSHVFYSCCSLKSITLPEGMTDVGYDYTFYNCREILRMSLPKSFNKSRQYAFYSCFLLERLMLPATTYLGNYCVGYCYALKRLVLSDLCTLISDYGMVSLMSLDKFRVPKKLAAINKNGCANMSTLTAFDIPETLDLSIATYAFSACYSMKKIVIPKGVSLGTYSFVNARALEEVDFQNTNVISVPSNCFQSCLKLKSVLFKNISSIGSYACDGCTGLESVEFDTNVVIGSYAFQKCSRLQKVVFHKGASEISTNAFAQCYAVKLYDFRNASSVPTLVHTNAFPTLADDCQIVVPDSLYDNWIAATNWLYSPIKSKIVKASEYTE